MPIIKVRDIAYVRLQSPDLERAQTFLTDFGLLVQERTEKSLRMRGTGTRPFVHVTELGEPKVLGIAFMANSADDLRTVAALEGAGGIEDLDGNAGGKRVRLRDPHGMQVEIVHGTAPVAPLPIVRSVLNVGSNHARKGELARPPAGPAQVKRLGHAVLGSPDIGATLRWYRETLGLISSDDVYAGEPGNIIGSFNRCDRGPEFVDHHTLFVAAGGRFGLNHVAFEVEGIDDVMLGNKHLEQGGYKHVWGIGRHYLGSQIFDYWADPWGRVHEHWTDGDLLNAASPSNVVAAEVGMTSQWGDGVPQELMETAH